MLADYFRSLVRIPNSNMREKPDASNDSAFSIKTSIKVKMSANTLICKEIVILD